jgi:hypothetical protein
MMSLKSIKAAKGHYRQMEQLIKMKDDNTADMKEILDAVGYLAE